MKMKLHSAADALISLSPIVLLLTLCLSLLITPVKRHNAPVKKELKRETGDKNAVEKTTACISVPHFPCFRL